MNYMISGPVRFIIVSALMFSLFPSCPTFAANNAGVLFGDNHAIFFSAAPGWVFDNQSGVNQGLYMVFYPEGYTWQTAPAVAYSRVRTKSKKVQAVHDQVIATLDEFRQNGHSNYIATKKNTIKVLGGKEAQIYFYGGDNWGNYEAVGYIEEKNTIDFLVFNAKSKEIFSRYLEDFMLMLVSYKNIESISVDIDDAKFDKLKKEAEQMELTSEGRKYLDVMYERTGTQIATLMRQCVDYEQQGRAKRFEIVYRADREGNVLQTYARQKTVLSKCFERGIATLKLPAHNFDRFLVYIEMDVAP